MKKSITVLLLLCVMCCYGQHKVCKYKMVAPVQSESLRFSDSLIMMNFDIGEFAIEFYLHNRLNNSIQVVWNECSVSPGGVTSRILLGGMALDENSKDIPTTRIPPGNMVNDQIIPVSHIYSSLYDNHKDMIPLVIPRVGSEVSLFMLMKINGREVEYNFKFKVAEVL